MGSLAGFNPVLPDRTEAAAQTRGRPLEGFAPRIGPALEELREPRRVLGQLAPGEVAPTPLEALRGAVPNVIPSSLRVGKELGEGALQIAADPKAAALGLGAIAKGVYSKFQGRAGEKQDLKQKEKDEAIVNSMMDDFAYLNPSDPKTSFWKAFMESPAQVGLDTVGNLVGGAGIFAKGARIARLPGVANRIDSVSRAADLLHPIGLATRGAETALNLASAIPRGVMAGATGVPMADARLIAATAARNADPALRAAYMAAHKKGDARPLFDAVDQTIKKIDADNYKDFTDGREKAGARAKQPSIVPIANALAREREAITLSTGPNAAVARETQRVLDEIEFHIAPFMGTGPGIPRPTFDDLDLIKRSIDQIPGHPVTGRRNAGAMAMYHAVGDELRAVSPAYDDLMKTSQANRTAVEELRKNLLGGGSRKDAIASLTKMLKQQKSANGRRLLDTIAKIDPSIPYMMAGHRTNEWFPRSGALGSLLRQGALPASIFSGGALIPPVVVAEVLASPKLYAKAIRGAVGAKNLASEAVRIGAPAANILDASREGAEAQPDPIWNRLLIAESGGRQFDNSNKPITSPKGAVGIAQVMPGTGPEAAKLAGLPWDENRFRNDAKYNETIGRAYYDKQARDFGSPAAALAAYNAGPTAVRQAQQRARAAGSSDFLSYLPKETQDYVRKILGPQAKAAYGGRIQRASGGRAGMNHAAMAEKLCAMAARSKNALGKATKPLLQTSDDAIATALAVANRTI